MITEMLDSPTTRLQIEPEDLTGLARLIRGAGGLKKADRRRRTEQSIVETRRIFKNYPETIILIFLVAG